jgi:hypothetical protein
VQIQPATVDFRGGRTHGRPPDRTAPSRRTRPCPSL